MCLCIPTTVYLWNIIEFYIKQCLSHSHWPSNCLLFWLLRTQYTLYIICSNFHGNTPLHGKIIICGIPVYSGDSLVNYLPQRSWAKVMFLQACVCPQGGCMPQCMLGYPPDQTPPRPGTPQTRHPPPLEQTPPPDQTTLWPGTPLEQTSPPEQTPPPGSWLQHTVNERPVRILLECILVTILFSGVGSLTERKSP